MFKFIFMLLVIGVGGVSSMAGEPFSISFRGHGSPQYFSGTFTGEYSWAPPVLTVRLSEGTITSNRVIMAKPPIEIRAALFESTERYPFYNRVLNSTNQVDVNEVLKEGDSASISNKKFTFQIPRKTKKDLQDMILGFQFVVEQKVQGHIYFMASDTFLFSDRSTNLNRSFSRVAEDTAASPEEKPLQKARTQPSLTLPSGVGR